MVKFPSHAAVAGSLGGVLIVGAVFSLGSPPLASDGPNQMAAILADGRGRLVVAVFGAGLGLMFGLWFLSVLRNWLRITVPEEGEELATAAFVGAALAMTLALVGVILFYGAAYDLAARGGSDALQGLVDSANAALMLSKFAFALFVVAVSVAASRSGSFPSWFTRLGLLAALFLVGSSVGLFTRDAFTEFGGPLDLYGLAPAGLWSVLLVVLLCRGDPSTPRA